MCLPQEAKGTRDVEIKKEEASLLLRLERGPGIALHPVLVENHTAPTLLAQEGAIAGLPTV